MSSPPPPLPDPEHDRRLAEQRAARERARRAQSASKAKDKGQPAPASKSGFAARLSPRTWAIVIAVVVVAVVILVGTVIGRDSSGDSSTIKTDDAVSTLQSLLDGVDRDTSLGSCPFGSASSIARDIGGDVEFSSTPNDAVPMIIKGDESSVDEVLCTASTPDDRLRTSRTIYVYATPVPKGSYTDYLSNTLLAGAKVKLEDPIKHAGGTIDSWCTTPTAVIKGSCGADWVASDGSVVFGIQVAGGEITAKQVVAALQHELPAMVDRFGADAPTAGSVPSSGPSGSSVPIIGTVPTTVT